MASISDQFDSVNKAFSRQSTFYDEYDKGNPTLIVFSAAATGPTLPAIICSTAKPKTSKTVPISFSLLIVSSLCQLNLTLSQDV